MLSDQELLDAVKQRDFAHNLSLLFAPAEARRGLAALYLFAFDMRDVHLKISEPLTGEMRLQWWRDCLLDSVSGGNPVAEVFLEAVNKYRLSVSDLIGLIDGHGADLYHERLIDVNALEAYAQQTHTVVIRSAAQILGPNATKPDDPLWRLAGNVSLQIELIRQLLLQGKAPLFLIPQSVLDAAGVRPDLEQGRERLIDLLVRMTCDNVEQMQSRLRSLPTQLRPAILPLVPACANLIKHRSLRPSPLSSYWQITKRALLGWR